MKRQAGWFFLALACILAARSSDAQQVAVTTPRVGVQDGFYERYGVGWGGRWQGPWGRAFFGWNSPPVAPFGIGAAAPGWSLGLGSPGRGLWLNFYGASGSHRSWSMDSASVTIPNGGFGVIQDATIIPFVTGLVPVVGYSMTSPVVERLARREAGEIAPSELTSESVSRQPAGAIPSSVSSTAERGDISVAEIRRQQAAERSATQSAVEQTVAEAQEAENAGRFGVARVRYRQAANQADGQRKQELLRKLESLRDK